MKKKISTLVLVLFSGLAAPAQAAPQQDASGDTVLTGAQIKRLFSGLRNAGLPDDGSGQGGSDVWRFSFAANGTWDAVLDSGSSLDAYGGWHLEGDTVCVNIRGGSMDWSAPYEGCFGVKVRTSDGTIAAVIPSLDLDRFVMKQNAYSELAWLNPARSKSAEVSQTTVARPAKPSETAVARRAELQRRLEVQRLALERQRLELERQKLEMRKQALLLQKKQATADIARPVIDIGGELTTIGAMVTLTGVAKDNGRLIRVAVAGRKVPFDIGTGRFSVEIPVELGETRIPITATDDNGNEAERIVHVTRKRDIPDVDFGRYHAIVIGIDDYEALPKLKTAVADARAVAGTLQENYGYKVRLLENPTRSDIIDTFDELRESLNESDNLLIYYAGHGWRDAQSGRGYWLPRNARSDRRSRWLSNATLTDALQALLAKHVMVVADSCYSGTLTRSIKVPQRNKAYLERIAEMRSRVVLSSGGLEPVADSGGGAYSVFAAEFLKALRANEGVMDGTQMFEHIRKKVVLNADQTPEYSDIRRAGHEGGDFIFVREN